MRAKPGVRFINRYGGGGDETDRGMTADIPFRYWAFGQTLGTIPGGVELHSYAQLEDDGPWHLITTIRGTLTLVAPDGSERPLPRKATVLDTTEYEVPDLDE